MRVTPLGFCLRVVVNENPLNLEKMILIFRVLGNPIQGDRYLTVYFCEFTITIYRFDLGVLNAVVNAVKIQPN